MKDHFGNEWIECTVRLDTLPVGTKAKSVSGGYWERVDCGWKWCTGATFVSVGADWDRTICLPIINERKS